MEIRFGTCSVQYEMRLLKFAKTQGKHGKIMICSFNKQHDIIILPGYFRQLQTQGIAMEGRNAIGMYDFQLQIRGSFKGTSECKSKSISSIKNDLKNGMSQYNLFMNDKLHRGTFQNHSPKEALCNTIIAYLQTPIAVRWYCIVPSMRHDG